MKGLLFEMLGSHSKSPSLKIKSWLGFFFLSFLLVFIDPLSHLEGGCRRRNRLTHITTVHEAGLWERERKGVKIQLAALYLFTLFPLLLTSAI